LGARLDESASRIGVAAAGAFATLRWRVGYASVHAGRRLRALQAEHGRVSGLAGLALLLCLGTGGVVAAVFAAGGRADVVGVNYTGGYVTVTGLVTVTTPTGVETRATTVTERGKRIVRTRVIRGPEGLRTVREEIQVAGPVQQLPGETKTVKVQGPTKTVTVQSPPQTVTEVVTETVTTTVEEEHGGG